MESPVAPAPPGDQLLLEQLSWRPSSRRLPTIDALSLAIAPGQRVLLAGSSGSGKSTVLRALAGLLDASTGDLEGQQRDPTRPGERGMLLQQPLHALVGASIGRDAAFGPENIALPRPAIQDRVTGAMRDAAVDLDADRMCLDASGGQQQRIALAGALALEPDALLLDEPTSMLDAQAAAAVRRAVLAAVGERTLVVAEHRIEPWLEHVDRLVVLGPQARILADGPPGALLAEQRDVLAQAGLWLPGIAPAHTDAHTAGTADSSDAAPPPVLRLRALAIRRRGAADGPRRPAPVLASGIDRDLAPGALCAVTGPSGAGKTTLLRVVLGLDAPAAGSIQGPPPERIAWVPQEPEHSFVATTVREEVTASPRADDPRLAERLLERAGLAHLTGANPYAISGGEQRRLALVAALAARPQLLVLDEPTVGLDQRRWEAVTDLIDEARAQGCTVLAATHDPDLIARADARIRIGEEAQGAVAPPRPVATAIRPVERRPRALADRLNPLTALVIAALGVVGSLAVSDWRIGLAAVLPILLLAPLATRSLRAMAPRIAVVLFSAIGLAWSTALLSPGSLAAPGSWLLGAKEALRITAFVAPGVLVFACVDPTALGDALGGRLRLPGRVVAASVSGLVRAGHVARQWEVIMTARQLRGLGAVRSWRHPVRTLTSTVRMLASATFALLVDSLRGAGQQALAMDARGFAQAQHRTWALPSRFGAADAIGLVAGLWLAIGPWAAAALLR